MIAEIGQFSLILAFCMAIVQSIFPLVGAQYNRPLWMALAKPAVRSQWLLLAIAMVCLGTSFLINDFSVQYVAQNSNSTLPVAYRIAAIWGGHEGSLLLWAFLLNCWGVAVSFRSKHLTQSFVARVFGVLGIISTGFLSFMLFTSNPFKRLIPAALNGADLNPLLQDPALVAHPPMLYMGYVGFSITFCLAIAALLEGKLDASWARWSRPWAIAAWSFLTFGIGLGSWWAYYELGWGGWWFWDPVENASLMPWLAGTALLHSLATTDKRSVFKQWTVLIAILAFSLSLLGTFLVRSGVLTSVHAFATDPARGIFILVFLSAVVGGSLTLYGLKVSRLHSTANFSWCSREIAILINNILLLVALATVMLGTLYPLVLDVLNLGKISVGPPYFNAVIIPVMAPLLIFMPIGQRVQWRNDHLLNLIHRFRWPALISVSVTLATQAFMHDWSAGISFGLFISSWIICSVIRDFISRAIKSDGRWNWKDMLKFQRSFIGMCTAHLGIGLFVMGVTISGGFNAELETSMMPGESVKLADYTFTFVGAKTVQGANYSAQRGEILVARNEKPVTTLFPEKRNYYVQNRVMTEASIDAGFSRHLYASLGNPVGAGAWSVRLYYKPFIQWLWTGVLCMALGGILAASDRRYRISVRRKRTVAVAEGLPVKDGSQ